MGTNGSGGPSRPRGSVVPRPTDTHAVRRHSVGTPCDSAACRCHTGLREPSTYCLGPGDGGTFAPLHERQCVDLWGFGEGRDADAALPQARRISRVCGPLTANVPAVVTTGTLICVLRLH